MPQGAGIAVSLTPAQVMSGLLFGVSARDGLTILSFVAVLGAVELAANCVPARRAAKIDPMVALRNE